MRKIIFIMAKSAKEHNYCIAGKDLMTNRWIRLVSDEEGGAISDSQSKVTFSGAQCGHPWPVKVFSVVEVELTASAPLIGQPENWIIGGGVWQLRNYKKKDISLEALIDNPKDLWGVGYKIPESEAYNVDASLYFVRVDELRVYKNESRKQKAEFVYNGIMYRNFAVTDKEYFGVENQYIGEAYLVVSLGQSYNNSRYKIVGKIHLIGDPL